MACSSSFSASGYIRCARNSSANVMRVAAWPGAICTARRAAARASSGLPRGHTTAPGRPQEGRVGIALDGVLHPGDGVLEIAVLRAHLRFRVVVVRIGAGVGPARPEEPTGTGRPRRAPRWRSRQRARSRTRGARAVQNFAVIARNSDAPIACRARVSRRRAAAASAASGMMAVASSISCWSCALRGGAGAVRRAGPSSAGSAPTVSRRV